MFVCKLFAALLLCVATSHAGKVLLASYPYGSHMIIMNKLGQALLAHGHQVTFLLDSQDPSANKLQKLGFKVMTYHWPENESTWRDEQLAKNMSSAVMEGVDVLTPTSALAFRTCDLIMKDKGLTAKVSGEHFDLVLVDYFPICHCIYILPYTLGIPFISIAPGMDDMISGIPNLPSFSPVLLTSFPGKMNFKERFINTILYVILQANIFSPLVAHSDFTLLRKYVNDPEINDWFDLARKASLFIMTRGVQIEPPMLLFPNVISVEAITAAEAKPLPKDLAELTQNAPHGFVLVSFGSTLKHMPEETTSKFLSAFATRKELIIWKFSMSKTSQLVVPPNVKLMNWMPQNDLMGQKNLRLFITHGGNNGLYESLYHGVPLIAFPFFGDQPHNARMLEEKGFGLRMDIKSFTAEELMAKMDMIIADKNYSMRTRRAADMLRGAPMNGTETAVYWIEHVMKYGGDHLRPLAMDMPAYQYWMFDVFVVLFIIFALVVASVTCLAKMVIKRFGLFEGTKKKVKKQ